jgi:hypothetical protein
MKNIMATTRLSRLALAGALTAASLWAIGEFTTKAAGKYPAHQAQGDVVVGVMPYHTDKLAEEAFGKADPFKYGFVPMLVVITNGSDHALSLEGLTARFITSRRDGLEPWSAQDLSLYNPKGHKPKDPPPYLPRLPGLTGPKVKKGPLAKPEIEAREFKAPVVPPRSSASGFFYYNLGESEVPFAGASMYISGVRDMTTGKDLFYFEIPLDKYGR